MHMETVLTPTDEESVEAQVTRRALSDPSFAQMLRSDARRAIEVGLGIHLDTTKQIRLIEEHDDEVVLVVPAASRMSASDLTFDVTPFAGTGVSNRTGCHQCC